MRVRLGWSGEIEPNVWSKADIELEEEDLNRMLMEQGLPDTLAAKLPTRLAYRLLQAEAELLLLQRLSAQGYPADKAQARTRELEASQDAVMTPLRARLAQ